MERVIPDAVGQQLACYAHARRALHDRSTNCSRQAAVRGRGLDALENFPRVLTCWRANILRSSSKGNEYFLKHLLGFPETAQTAPETAPELRPRELTWRDPGAVGKRDLMVTIDFRMTGIFLYLDVVFPAATW